MPTAKTIQGVLNELDQIIAECNSTNSRLGLFAYVYRRTTAEIANEINKGNFEDNQRMEDFDVAFANLYLKAYQNYKINKPVSQSWAYAFDQAEHKLTIIQHILFGMNVHINLDLAIAAAQTMKGENIQNIENDFNKVNDILFQITNELQDRLSRVSPMMFLLDWVVKNTDEKIIDFSMRKARTQAWNSANLIWSIGNEYNEKIINDIDELVLGLNKLIRHPKTFSTRFLLRLMQLFESNDIRKIFKKLKAD